MNLKKQRQKLGKRIRKETGLKLPIAMHIAKLASSYRFTDILRLYPEYSGYRTDCPCCGPYLHIGKDIAGRDSVRLDDLLNGGQS